MSSKYVIERIGEPLENKGYNVKDNEVGEVIAWFQYLSDADLFVTVLNEQEQVDQG
ncbi:hypothetical protein [Thermoactinomyces mirandus]|uniref:Uncharacterized protein n=1 Tax=Thermoactinomyces mirandus TaxID=2756294 RepID=A0A7W2APC4_9BACL|nr:hypothetical protein [Thermoactinomyces mirandus]MBA4600799.1 hypothetical protein [Thermoactinomyces mirandus]